MKSIGHNSSTIPPTWKNTIKHNSMLKAQMSTEPLKALNPKYSVYSNNCLLYNSILIAYHSPILLGKDTNLSITHLSGMSIRVALSSILSQFMLKRKELMLVMKEIS